MDAGQDTTERFEMVEITKADPATADNLGYIDDSLNRERQRRTTEPGKDASAGIEVVQYRAQTPSVGIKA